MTLEERPRPIMRRAREDVSQPELPGVLDGAVEQLSSHALTLEPRNGVETNDLAGAGLPVRLGRKRAHSGEMAGADRRTVSAHEDLTDLIRAPESKVPLPLPALEELFHLGELVHPQAFHAAIVLQGKEGPRPFVREQFTSHALQIAQVDRLHSAVERVAHRFQKRSPVAYPDPLRLATPQQLLQHRAVHERHEARLVADASFAIHENELAYPEAHPEPLREIGEDFLTRADPNHRAPLVTEQTPDPAQERDADRSPAPVAHLDPPPPLSLRRPRRQDFREHTDARVPSATLRRGPPQKQEAGDVAGEIRHGIDERVRIARVGDHIGGHRHQERLAAKLVEIEALLLESLLEGLLRGRAGITWRHFARRSYHNRRMPATTRRPRREWGFSLLRGVLQGSARPLALATALTLCNPGLRPAAAAGPFVAAEHPLAVAAGTEILAQGGNATDAAVAAVAASGVVHPVSCGLGGGGFMLIYDGASGAAHVLDYRETAPADAIPARFLDRGMERIDTGPLSVGVPGEPAGLVAAHRRFGSLPMSTILAPAIRYARDGFEIDAHLADGIAEQREVLRADPTLAATFLRPDGAPLTTGERLRQPDLATSLELLSTEGSAPFYEGKVARAIAEIVGSGGLLRLTDLAAYRIRWRAPLVGTYRERTVFTMPPPGSGGVVLEALNVVSGYDLPALGFGSPTYLHLLAETMKAVFEDRARYYGDPDFTEVPIVRLLSPSHAGEIRARLSSIRPFDAAGKRAADAGTAHVSVLDGAGNAVAATTTINTAFGAGIAAPGTGIILNNQLADFSLRSGTTNVFGLLATNANVIAPGKRPLSSMSPTVVVRGRSPEIVIGGSGGPTIITATLQTLLALIDFGMDPQSAVAAPLIHHQGVPPVLLVEPGIPGATRTSLTHLGHNVREVHSLGSVSVVRVAAGTAAGAGAVRKGGAAAPPPAKAAGAPDSGRAPVPAFPAQGTGTAGQPAAN